jgi:hypothetical protein
VIGVSSLPTALIAAFPSVRVLSGSPLCPSYAPGLADHFFR